MEKEVLACKNPSQHGDKWLLNTVNQKNEKLPCFACCTLCLEDKQELCLRKRMILTCFRDLMESNSQMLINVVTSDDEVVFHTAHTFLNLLNCNDERLLKLSGECLLLFLIHMKKEGLGLSVMHRLTVEIEEDCNYVCSVPQFYVLGRIFQVFPELVKIGTCTKSKFLHTLANGLSYPSNEVKGAILFLLRQIYQNVDKNKDASRSLNSIFVKSFLRIVKCSQNKDLLKNALGLLQIFISKMLQNFGILFENSPDEISFTDVIKKIILSNEATFQVCIVQFMCQLISNQLFEKYIILLLEANIPEILFDALSTKDELLLESILCCLLLFTHHTEIAVKSRFVFGVGIIIEVCCSLLNLKNWRLLCIALNLLTSIITSNEYLLVSSNITFYYQSIQFTEKAFKIQNPTVLLAACKYFNEFLKNKDLPWALPLEQIHNNVNVYLKSQTKFVSALNISEQMKKHLGPSKSLPIEMKLLICTLDMISSCIRICKQYNSTPISVENGFSSPAIQNHNEVTYSCAEKSSQHLMMMCLVSLDENFVPCCLKMKATDSCGIAWFHLIQVLVIIFDEIQQQNILIYEFAKKLIKAGFFKYLFDLKTTKLLFSDCKVEHIKNVCNQCVKGLLKCILKISDLSDAYLKTLENGLKDLNDSLEECVSVLSRKSDISNKEFEEFWASSPQIVLLCLCYFSYLNEAFVISPKILIPHLIYFVTCNSDFLSSCVIILKHLIFLMAVCTYECMSKDWKFQTGLMEANMIIWDILPKLKSPLQVYTHHKYMLWWCFRNQAHNAFASNVLLTWLKFSTDEKHHLRHYAMKTIISLLYSSQNVQQTFVLLFDFSSSSDNEALVKFLKEANDLEVSGEMSRIKFQDLITLMIHHLHSFLIKLFVMKSENDEGLDKILCQGLDCLLWCHEQIENVEITPKILFHISKYCFLANNGTTDSIIACMKFLRFTLLHNKCLERAWHVMTGDLNFTSFFYKTFTSNSPLAVEALNLLISLFNTQVNHNLKTNIRIQIPPKQILRWLNSSSTQTLAYQLLILFINTEFQDKFLLFIPFDCSGNSFPNSQHLYYRLFSLYLQNAIISGNPIFLDETINSYLKFLNIVSKTDKHLENHIMLQPWIKILMESRLEKLDDTTCKLLEKWLSFDKVNASLIGVIQQFANKLQSVKPLSEMQRNFINKLCTGTYASFLHKETRSAFIQLNLQRCESSEEETDLVTQVQNLVANYVSNVP